MTKRTLSVLLFVCLAPWLLSCGGDNGVTQPVNNRPTVTSASPNSLARGARLTPLVLSGVRFTADTNVDMGSDISISSKQVADAQTINLTVSVSPQANPGPRPIVVSNSTGSSTADNLLSISDNGAPKAAFFISPSEGTLQTTFQLDASLSSDTDGRIATYKWQISNGTNSKGIRTQLQFKTKGSYTVVLTVTDDKGATSSAQKTLEVAGTNPPVAQFTVSPQSGTQMTQFSFDASASTAPAGTVKGYLWDFGDDTTSNGRITDHRFATQGDYEVLLRINDSNGVFSYSRRILHVSFFDKNQAVKDIQAALIQFMKLFGDLEHLSAETIVQGFSRSPDCHGREHEIDIIKAEQQNIRTSQVEFVGDPVVQNLTDRTANASITNRFSGIYKDGTSYQSGNVTHHFTMVNEGGTWKMCNFYVSEAGMTAFEQRLGAD